MLPHGNLKRLFKIIVAYDYGAALAGVDRGVGTSRPLTATENGIAVGIAMTPAILHQGEPRSVLVLNAAYMTALADFEDASTVELRDVALYTLAHECGHVHDLDVQATSLPNVLFNRRLGFRDEILFRIASGCWDEYIACRLSAFMGKESTLQWMEETFCAAIERAKNRADAAIRQYRMHHDVQRATDEASAEYKSVLVYWSYLLGHVDGLRVTLLIVNIPAKRLKERINELNAHFRLIEVVSIYISITGEVLNEIDDDGRRGHARLR